MYRILIVEDDRGIAEAVCRQAQMWGFETHAVQGLQNVMAELSAVSPHLVLLDISLPFYGGYHWCSESGRVSSVSILFLSSAADNRNIVMAMNLGAPDLCLPHDPQAARALWSQ